MNLLYTLLAIVSQTYSLLMVNFSNPTFFIFSAPWIRPNLSARMGDAELFKELGCLLLPNYVEKLNRQEVLFVSLNKTGTNLIIFLQPQREVLYILTSFWGVLHPKDGRNLLFPFFWHVFARFWSNIDDKWVRDEVFLLLSHTMVDKNRWIQL